MKFINAIIVAGIFTISFPNLARDDIENYIVGGVDSLIIEVPWQVYIEINLNGGTYSCGGTLISETWVITAAHCLSSNHSSSDYTAISADQVTVYSGSSNLFNGNMKRNRVIKLVPHPSYSQSETINDIALLQLSSEALPPAQSIKLMNISSQYDADIEFNNESLNNLLISGWGRTSTNGVNTDILQKTALTGIDDITCASLWGWSGHENDFICANGYNRGTCYGDSGGPLVWQDKNAKADPDRGYRLAGIVSFGNSECAYNALPDVFTQVSTYISWIKTQIVNYQTPEPTFTVDIYDIENLPTEKKSGSFDYMYLLLLGLFLYIRRE